MNEMSTLSKDSYLSKDNFEHIQRVAVMMSKSEMVPKGYKEKPADIIIAFEMGRALGLAPLQAIQNIAVINGKPSLYGDAIIAVCSGHPDFEDIEEKAITSKEGAIEGFICSVKRKNRSPVVRQFTINDAKKANLWGKAGPWSQYPDRMLQMRARGFALRDCFADALGGIRVIEETQDYHEIKDVTPRQSKEDLMALLKPQVDNNAIEVDKNTGEILEDIKQ